MWSVLIVVLGLVLFGNAMQHGEHLRAKTTRRMQWEYEKDVIIEETRSIRGQDARNDHRKHVEAMTELLFPHAKRSREPLLQKYEKKGKVGSDSTALQPFDYAKEAETHRSLTVPCVICRDMGFCSALNGFQIQEVYLPYNLNDLGTCKVLDALGEKVASEVFGNGRTFRDTPQCKDIVMQYLCLFYGSDNDMYTNECINQEDVSDSNPVNHKVAPRPPCRSFCVQVAEVCATDPKFMQLCYNIACPPMEDSCTPDPMVEGQVLAANIGCDMPYEINPYFKKNSASMVVPSWSVLLLLSSLCSVLLAL